MKKMIFFFLVFCAANVNAQSLKDALFSGNLKTDSSKLIRKSDDLSKLIDSTQKRRNDSIMAAKLKDSVMVDPQTGAVVAGTDQAGNPSAKPELKDNDVLLKEFVDSVISTLNTEVLPDKKIKSGSYFIIISYEIATNGQFAANSVTVNPENSFLQEQITQRLNLFAPRMNPVMFNGQARKVVRKYNFNLTKK